MSQSVAEQEQTVVLKMPPLKELNVTVKPAISSLKLMTTYINISEMPLIILLKTALE